MPCGFDAHAARPANDSLTHEFLSAPSLTRALSHENKRRYDAALPFPHAVLDDLFSREALGRVATELPERMGTSGCVKGVHRWACYLKKGTEYRKSTISQQKKMGD